MTVLPSHGPVVACGRLVESTFLEAVRSTRPSLCPSQQPLLYLLPTGVPQTLLFGDADRAVPGRLFSAYVSQAKAKGDRVDVINIPDAVHFEFLMPGTSAEKTLFDTLLRAARLK